MYMLFVIFFLALFVVLKESNEGWMALAVTFAILGIGIFLSTNNLFAMLSLSN